MKIALYIAFHNKSSIDCCKDIIGLISEKNQLVIDSKIKNDLSEEDKKKFSFFDSKKPIENDFNFPYLYDETQEVAKAYDAACTPDFYLYDSNLKLVYRGQLDNSRPGNDMESDGSDMENAIQCLKDGVENIELQKPSIGCNIKWK